MYPYDNLIFGDSFLSEFLPDTLFCFFTDRKNHFAVGNLPSECLLQQVKLLVDTVLHSRRSRSKRDAYRMKTTAVPIIVPEPVSRVYLPENEIIPQRRVHLNA